MSSLQDIIPGGFDADDHPDTGYDPIPAGDYEAMAVGMEVKDTKKRDGKYIKAEFEVVSGEFKGRKVFTNFNIQNPNQTAEEIGKKQFGALCSAVGNKRPNRTEELCNIPLVITVTIRKSDEYGDQNEVKRCKPIASGGSSGGNSQPSTSADAGTRQSENRWARG